MPPLNGKEKNEILVDFMMKRSVNTSTFFTQQNFRSRWFVLNDECIKYFDGSLGKRGKEKGSIGLTNIKTVETVEDGKLKDKTNVFQIMYRTEKGDHYTLYVVALNEDQRKKWVDGIKKAIRAKGISFLPKYHTGVWTKSLGRYNCCDQIDRNAPGCKIIPEEDGHFSPEAVASKLGPLPQPPQNQRPNPTPPRREKEKEKKIYIAAYDYKPSEEGDLELITGEEYEILKYSRDHWWQAKNKNGEKGFIPANYVKKKFDLEIYEWYHKGVTRDRSETILKAEGKEGCFMVRDSSMPGMYTLAILTSEGDHQVRHYHIKKNAQDQFYLAEKHCFVSIPDLIYYHKHNAGGLATRLKSPPSKNRNAPVTAGLGHTGFGTSTSTAGGGLFGQQQSSASSLFGQNKPLFSNPATTQSSGFGTRGFSFFNNAQQNKELGSWQIGFGTTATTQASTGFSSTGFNIGALAAKPDIFGASTGFGTTTSTAGGGLFGQQQSSASSLFGQNKPLFSNPATTQSSGFSFGTSTGSSFFNNAQQNKTPFGATATSTQPSLFGGGGTSTFGAATSTPSGFGGFGQTTHSGGLFGSKAPTFGTRTASTGFNFGAQGQSNLFAKPFNNPAFNTTTTASGFGASRLSPLPPPLLPPEILRMDSDSIALYKQALEEGKEYVHNIRIMMIGHSGVGKTTLSRFLLGDSVDLTVSDSTNGIEVHICRCRVAMADQRWISVTQDEKTSSIYKRLAKVIAWRQQRLDDNSAECQASSVAELGNGHNCHDGSDAKQAKDVTETAELDLAKPGNPEPVPMAVTEGDSLIDGVSANLANDFTKIVALDSAEPEDTNTSASASPDSSPVDAALKDLKALIQEAGQASSTETAADFADVSVWDFAGQFVFYSTHQMFLSPRAIYLLVTDISKHINDVVIEDECYFDSTGPKQCPISDFVDFWLNSIHSYTPSASRGVPPVILVGTHADKVSKIEDPDYRQKKSDAYFEAVRRHLSDNPMCSHLADEDFDIDNTVIDPKLEALKKKIFEVASTQPYWDEPVPAKWLPLEKALSELKETGLKVIDHATVEELNKSMAVPISRADELELFLRFQHESGNLLYFSDSGLRDKVVLDSQWLVDALKSLITAKMFCMKQPVIMKKWDEFFRKGILREELLDAVWKKENRSSFHDNRDHLLALMEKLNLIAKPTSSAQTEKEYYLAPCMLKDPPPKGLLHPCSQPGTNSTSVLCFSFSRKFLPAAVFHQLIATCLSKWPLWPQGKKDQIFCGCGVFIVGTNHQLTVCLKQYVIEMWVTKFGSKDNSPSPEICIQAREFIDDCLRHITGCLPQSPKFEVCIKCPEATFDCLDCNMPVDALRNEEEIACSRHDDYTHVCSSKQLMSCWYAIPFGGNVKSEHSDGSTYTAAVDNQVESTQKSNNQNIEVVADLKLYKDRLLSDGQGTPVYEGVFEDSIPVAVKKIHRTGPQNTSELNERVKILREVETLRKLPQFSHQNIVRFLKSEMRSDFLYIAFELCQGTLKDYVDVQANWGDKIHWKNVLIHMAEALHFLHDTAKVAHRDLKPSNVLLRQSQFVTKVVLADFGQSKSMADTQCSVSTATGTYGWIAPEAGTTPEIYHKESDIFSLGCLFYYVATRGIHPFGHNPIQRQTNISHSKSDLSLLQPCLGCLRELITDMIQFEPGDRPSARRVSKNPSLMANDVIMDFLHKASNRINGYLLSQQNILEDPTIIPGGNWIQLLPVNTQLYLSYFKLPKQKQPMFKGKEGSVRHLLRAIRNCSEHFPDLDATVRAEMGTSTSDHVEFWLAQFPWLLMHVHNLMKGDKSLMDSVRKS